jgi:hypothetical protein
MIMKRVPMIRDEFHLTKKRNHKQMNTKFKNKIVSKRQKQFYENVFLEELKIQRWFAIRISWLLKEELIISIQ